MGDLVGDDKRLSVCEGAALMFNSDLDLQPLTCTRVLLAYEQKWKFCQNVHAYSSALTPITV